MASAGNMAPLEALLGHSFTNPELLTTSLTHCSYANEDKSKNSLDNEKLEFLGDAVLDLIIGHYLMDRFPTLQEGELSMTRAQMVSEAGLTEVARELKLGKWLRLGKGEEQSGGRTKPSILSDALEAVIAAVYLDGGFDAAQRMVLDKFSSHTPATPGLGRDHKTRLQEKVQAQFKCTPLYELASETGPPHDRVFEVVVRVQGEEKARASARSKKAAEQRAAELALEALDDSKVDGAS